MTFHPLRLAREPVVRATWVPLMLGGIYNSGLVTLNDNSSITGNSARLGGGGIFNSGSVTLNDNSSITGNVPDNCFGC
jgi:hypothetical protein